MDRPVMERPIAFRDEMIPAILDGRKVTTWRLIKEQPKETHQPTGVIVLSDRVSLHWQLGNETFYDPFNAWIGVPGDRLWVREPWWSGANSDGLEAYAVADPQGRQPRAVNAHYELSRHWVRRRASAHLRREDARVILEVTGVSARRVQTITDEEAKLEGIEPLPVYLPNQPKRVSYVLAFHDLWNNLYSDVGQPWEKNPWAWVISFRRFSP